MSRPTINQTGHGEFTPPSSEANAHSLRLLQKLHTQIAAQGGRIRFEQFMQSALYQPELGYYRCGTEKFGAAGDFITAAEVSVLFARCLAEFILRADELDTVLEVGAGSGKMAGNILKSLRQLGIEPKNYFILEISNELRLRQRDSIKQLCPELLERVHWLDDLPEQFEGIVIANELLDAMPVRRFKVHRKKLFEQCVAWCDGILCYRDEPLRDVRLIDRIARLCEQTSMGDVDNYLSEVNFMAEDWVRTMAGKLRRGILLLIDYGYPRSAYYHAQRSGGTLMCHYQHRAHPDPLILPGLQDITAYIDFTAMADAALEGGMEIAGFTTQGHFLLNMGMLDLIAEQATMDERERLKLNNEIKQLTLETEMGEQFKVMACSKLCEQTVAGFSNHDLRHML